MYTLLKFKITFEEIENSHKQLVTSVRLTESYFGIQEMTSNLHQLLHLTKSVYDWGPLWSHSCFAFEDSNHLLVKSVNSAKGVDVQIIRFFGMSICSQILEEKFGPDLNEIVQLYCDGIQNKNLESLYRGNVAVYFNSRNIVDWAQLELLENLELKEYDVISATKAIEDGILFSSSNAISKKIDNSFGKLWILETYVQFINFIIDKNSKEEFLLYKQIHKSIDRVLSKNTGSLQRIMRINEKLQYVSITELVNICVVTKAHNFKYICELPNSILSNN